MEIKKNKSKKGGKNEQNLVDWEFMLSSDDIAAYLDLNSLFELSLTNKYVRKALNPKVYTKFSLNEKNSISFFIGKSKKAPRINPQLKSFKGFGRNVRIGGILEDYLILRAINYFPRLNNLTLVNIKLPLNSVVQIVENLNNLEFLKLSAVLATKPSNELQIAHQLILPPKLKSLTWIDANDIGLDFISRPDILELAQMNHHILNLGSQKLPNLTHFIYDVQFISRRENISRFVKSNHQLKELTVNLDDISYQALHSIHINSQLVKLVVSFKNTILQSLPPFEFELTSIKRFEIDGYNSDTIPIIAQLIQSMPNIEELTIPYETWYINFINSLLLHLPHITKLSLINQSMSDYFVLNNLYLSPITSLTLKSFNFNTFNLYQFVKFPNLSLIKLSYNELDIGNDPDYYSWFTKFTEWHCIRFETLINCYKI